MRLLPRQTRQNRRLKDIMTVLGGSALLLQQTRQTNKLTN